MIKYLKKHIGFKASILLLFIVAIVFLLCEQFIDNTNHLNFKIKNFSFSLYWLIKTLILIILFLCVGSYINSKIQRGILNKKDIDSNLKQLISRVFSTLIYIVLFFIILNTIGIDITSFTVIGGALSFGIGFSLKKIVANFISGVILLFEKSFNQGDLIELNDGTKGVIVSIYSRSTLLKTFDGGVVIIPNESLLTNKIINWSYLDRKIKVKIKFKVIDLTNINKAKSLILGVAQKHSLVSDKLKPICVFNDFQDDYIQLELRVWISDITKDIDFIKNEIKEEIWHLFRKNNIRIAVVKKEY